MEMFECDDKITRIGVMRVSYMLMLDFDSLPDLRGLEGCLAELQGMVAVLAGYLESLPLATWSVNDPQGSVCMESIV